MRSSTSAPLRGQGHERRNNSNVDVNANAAGWPLVRNGKVPVMEGSSGMASQGGENSKTVDILAQEVEDLIERQPQFAFLKPCRQLEKHYATKRTALIAGDSTSFRHSHAATEAKSSKDKRGELTQLNACSSGRVEEAHPKRGSTSAGTIRELLSCDGIELNGFTVEGKSGTQGASSTARVVTKEYHDAAQAARCHGRGGHFHRNSGEKIWRISSTRCSIHEKEAHIDLVNPAAAKFLMEMSPGMNNASPPAVAVPFKWEDAPGRAKAHAAATAHPALQLPPRLAAVPRSDTAFSRQLQVSVISHPLAGLFPCIGASSPSPSQPLLQQQQQLRHQQQQQDHITWMHYRASKSYGGVYQNSRKQSKSFSQPLASTDQSSSMGVKPRRHFSSELGDQSSSTGVKPRRRFSSELGDQSSSTGVKPRRHFSSELGDQSSSTGVKPRRHFSSELGDQSSSMGVKPRRHFSSELGSASSADASTSSSSILHGSQQSSSSRTYLSCELGSASTPRTVGSKSSSSASYDSIGEDFDHDDGSATSPHHSTGGAPGAQSRRQRQSEPKGLLKLCKRHGNCLRKAKSRKRICSPEVWAPTLATYFQRLDMNEEPLLEKQAAVPTSSGYLNSKGEPQPLHSSQVAAPTSSGYLNSKGEPQPLHSAQVAAPTSSGYLNSKGEPVPLLSAQAAAPKSSGYLNSKGEPIPLYSAQCTAPTSSGYLNSKMDPVPFCSTQGAVPTSRGSLNSKGESVPMHCGGDGGDESCSSPEVSPRRPTRLPYKMPSVAEQEWGRLRSGHHRSSLSMDLQCPSPAYAAALELLSPAAVTLMASRRHQRNGTSRTVGSTKAHRRVQFILSMCKTLKRVLFRQQPRRSVIGTRLMYHDERAPTTFQFSKPN